MIKDKKGQNVLDNISAAGVGFLTLAIVFIIGFIFLDNLDNELCAGQVNNTDGRCMLNANNATDPVWIGGTHNQTGYTAVQNLTSGMSNVTEQLPLLGLVIGLGAVFIIALGAFAAKKYL